MRILILAFVLLASVAEAQVLPAQYRLTRTLPGPAQSFVVARSALSCDLPVAGLPGAGFRLSDPANATRDCQYLGLAGGVIPTRVPGTVYAFTLEAGNAAGEWSPAVAFPDVSLPSAPANPRLRPAEPALAFAGDVQNRFRYGGLDIATIRIDGTPIDVLLGATTLTTPSYAMQRGDRVTVQAWRP